MVLLITINVAACGVAALRGRCSSLSYKQGCIHSRGKTYPAILSSFGKAGAKVVVASIGAEM